MTRRVLICDLNNFARYPTISVGYLVAILRGAGMTVDVFSPWSIGIGGYVREPIERPWSLIDQRMRYWSALSPSPFIRRARNRLDRVFVRSDLTRQASRLEAHFRRALARRPDVVMISTYLAYRDITERLCGICCDAGIPAIVGGPYFAEPRVREAWRGIRGLTALAVGENEIAAPQIVEVLANGGVPETLPSVATRLSAGPRRPTPFRALDDLPYPDYSDFPWAHYPTRIVSVIAGRGCGWGACRFCSDITSTAGRTFRGRSAANVVDEVAHQCGRYDARHVVFTDLKLNSDLEAWHGLVEGLSRSERPVSWIGAVHIDGDGSHGLEATTLRRAADAGLVRLTTGLESGSQRVLDLMKKGTSLAESARVLRDAASSGISVRTTVMVAFPGEVASDVGATARFLEAHRDVIERVSLNRFTLMSGSVIDHLIERRPASFETIRVLGRRDAEAVVDHVNLVIRDRRYRRELGRLLGVVHDINRRPIRARAAVFAGVM